MATKDLERHLKVGWETIATAAGAIATLTLAPDKLPLPLAVTASLVVLFWGMLNIFDADYWATRAIAFLANVEAVYFCEEDRACFNPYIGRHPPYKMLDSLRYQYYAVLCFILVTIAFFIWQIDALPGGIKALVSTARALSLPRFVMWILPGIAFLALVNLALTTRLKRVGEYLRFVTTSPGPGIVKTRDTYRGVDLKPGLESSELIPGVDVQQSLREALLVSQRRLATWCTWVRRISIAVLVVLLCVAAARERLATLLLG